jgi:DNA polymerase-3 subunit chi
VTEISFHFNVPDRLVYATGLIRTALKRKMGTVVVAETATLQRLSHLLWTRSPTSFLPHCLNDAPEALLTHSPVVLTRAALGPWSTRPLLINLLTEVPVGFEHYDRMLEVVSHDESDRQRARDRWKYYASRGYNISKFDGVVKKVSH